MLAHASPRGSRFVATTSSSARALPRRRARRARPPPLRPRGGRRRPRRSGRPCARARGTGARDRLALPARRPRAGGAACAMARVTERLAVLAFAALHRRGDHRDRLRASATGSASFCYDHRRAAARRSPLDDPDWTLLRNLGIGLVVVLWLATAYWTFKDARRRIEDPWLVGLATLRRALPAVPRADHLHVLPPARVPPGRARARARDQGDGGAARAARPALPGLPREGRVVVPRLPRVHDAAASRRARRAGSRSSRSGRCARTARRTSRPGSRRSRI